ncbi:MAG: hypothetical protein ACE5FU_11700, partial [Nitrospinota bacterium]
MESEPKSLPEYRNAFRALKTGKDPAGKKAKIRIACLSSFTITGIEEILSVKAHFLGIETSFYTGKYNQVFNEIMSPESDLYSFKPD